MDKILELRGITCDYGNDKIVNDLAVDFDSNTWVGIIGGNGSGKSTLVKILSGMQKYQGTIKYNGSLLDDKNFRGYLQNVGVVFDTNYYTGETVLDNLTFTLENLNYSEVSMKESIENICYYFEIGDILDKHISTLDNSLRQVVNIASSLIHNPKILILDDAMEQMTPSAKAKVMEALWKYKKKYKITIIMISNNLEDVMGVDRLIVMDKGRIVMNDTVIKVFKNDTLINQLGLKVPFMIQLSLNLMLYGLVRHIYLNQEKLVDDLWK